MNNMNKLRSIAWLVGAVSMTVWLNGCDGSSPTTASDVSTPTIPTITITDAGVSPTELRISVDQQVLIVNNGASIHQLQSNPNPAHSDCPPMNTPGTLNPGQSGLTGTFTLSGTCGFHDHQSPLLTSLQGFVLVGVNEPDPNSTPGY